jgi:hypothetical protein
MSKDKNMPLGISIFLVLFLIFEIYYFFYDYLFTGLYLFHGYTLDSLENIPYLIVTVFLYVIVVFCLYKITIGIILRENWARKFTIIYAIWASIWPLWAIIIGNRLYENIIFFIIYVIVILYLLSSYVEKTRFFTYGPYTLYTRKVDLKNTGKVVDIYYFSTHTPKSGSPCAMPDGYEVGVNPSTKLPYLRKIGKKTVKTIEVPIEQMETVNKKPANNVVYVVSKPSEGKGKGDWAVRTHGKIFSTHRTQENAINAAKILAKKRNVTVMIQSKSGAFREGFKPKK